MSGNPARWPPSDSELKPLRGNQQRVRTRIVRGRRARGSSILPSQLSSLPLPQISALCWIRSDHRHHSRRHPRNSRVDHHRHRHHAARGYKSAFFRRRCRSYTGQRQHRRRAAQRRSRASDRRPQPRCNRPVVTRFMIRRVPAALQALVTAIDRTLERVITLAVVAHGPPKRRICQRPDRRPNRLLCRGSSARRRHCPRPPRTDSLRCRSHTQLRCQKCRTRRERAQRCPPRGRSASLGFRVCRA